MDSHVGLDYIVDNPDYCAKLASALDTACPSVKKQVIELLSALCVYSQDGKQRAIDTLHAYQERKGERYRLRIVVDELQKATTEDYRTALLAFVNCLVISTPVLKDRIRLRNEFIGLKLLLILNDLRKSHTPDLRVQLDVFDDQREADEVLTNQGPPGIDLSSHVDVFYAILGQIADTPQEVPFLSILQHLLRLDPKDAASDLAWDTAETLVHRATLLENREDATKLLRSPSLQANLCCHCRAIEQTGGTTLRKASLPANNSGGGGIPSTVTLPPSVPSSLSLPLNHSPTASENPETPGGALPPPLPPPPPPLIFPNSPAKASADAPMEPPPLPPPLQAPRPARILSPEPAGNQAKLLPQQEIPTPKSKMKTINWNKIPNHKVIGKRNIWSLVANNHQNSPMADLDWAEMEGLFCQQAPPMLLPPSTCSSNQGVSPDAEKRRREPTEISLLDGKRSLNVNIFLKQFRSSNGDIIRLIREGGHDDIGAEKLRGLLKILPEVDELEMLKNFDGDKSKLGNAEKFFLQLIQVPNYKLRIECMLLKEEFAANMGYLEPSINSMILAGEDLMTNKPLQEVLYMVLVAGNFLNSGGYAGNAAGVKLSSLQKLTEIRANKPGMNLIHYVALQAERKRKNLLNFTENMTALEAATKTTVEQLNNEFNTLETRIKKIKAQIQLPSTEADIQEQMAQFLQVAEQEMSQLRRDLEELDGVRRTLAEFFCEDANIFKIEECFKVFHQFCQRFNQAVTENERRRVQEEQILARRKQREEQLLARKRLLSSQQIETPGSESESNLIDYGLLDPCIGVSQRNHNRGEARMKRLQNGGVTSDDDVSVTGSPSIRRRLGSCSGGPGPDHQLTKEDALHSPDVTPNGTLRRRRSRLPCEDDRGNLMDFLRTSGQDGSRERKSWGSLDRSWARRARGQSRRGDLLNADFTADRERASSPSPLAESKPFLQEEEAKPAGKAWRQKIEAWLSENEKEDRAGEELQRKARQLHQAKRRSFEESEGEGKSPLASALPIDTPVHNHGYSEVYDWRPSVEKTDVMRTMEAIEEAQPQVCQKDKSPWRKSSLNVPNSVEETDPRQTRRLRSRLTTENVLTSSTLQAIKEEDRKKNKMNEGINVDPQDELTIYLRQPYGNTQTPTSRRFSRLKKNDDERISDKIEIDSDNIETPPATRKLFSPPREVKPVEKEPCKRERCNGSVQGRDSRISQVSKSANTSTDLGNGNFDRYSATRRTRRYKRIQDTPEKEAKTEIAEIEKPVQRPHSLSLPAEKRDLAAGTASLHGWQEKLKCGNVGSTAGDSASYDIDAALAEITRSGEDLQRLSRPIGQRNSRLPVSQPPPPAVLAVTNTVLSPVMQESRPREPMAILTERAVTSRERHRSMIDPSQVKEAIRLTNNPPSQVSQEQEEVDGAARRDKNEQTRRQSEKRNNQHSNNQETRDGPQIESPPTIVTDSSIFRSKFIPDISVSLSSSSSSSFSSSSTALPLRPALLATPNKGRDQEMNDEGFEETQSLVSETLSQETSSGNYETDAHDSTRCSPAESCVQYTMNVAPKRYTCSITDDDDDDEEEDDDDDGDADGDDDDDENENRQNGKRGKPAGKAFEKRASSMRRPGEKSSFLPKRTPSSSLKRETMPTSGTTKAETRPASVNSLLCNSPPKNEVERSGSRSSLRSSRSSLNSATSVNTVRNLAPSHTRLRSYTSAIRALTNDLRKGPPPSTPLPPKDPEKRVRMSPRTPAITRIPASRSSSSGSSVGPAARTVRKSSEALMDTAKGNKGRTITSRSSSSGSGSSTRQIIAANRQSVEKPTVPKGKLVQPRAGARNHSFMRPTAASVNKGSISSLPRGIKTLVK